MEPSNHAGTISLREAEGLLGEALFVDVREPGEWELGHVPDALLVPLGELDERADEALPDHDREIVVYCAVGRRSLAALATLRGLGYERARHLADGFTGWEAQGLPVVVPSPMAADQRRRYSRHMLIPEVGLAGQQKLLASRILLIGAGGLGSPAALYLAAAGIGRLGIVDDDVVDDSNLQRQVLHSTAALGEPKVESAGRRVRDLNPDVEPVLYRERLTAENADRILGAGWDVVVDGADNF